MARVYKTLLRKQIKEKRIPWNKGMKGWTSSGSFKKGRIPSKEELKKLSEVRKRQKVSEQTKKNLSEYNKRTGIKPPTMRGKDHYAYIDGRTLGKNKRIYNNLKRRHRRLGLKMNSFHTSDDWQKLKVEYNYCCANCGMQEPFEDQCYKYLTEDHIIPLSKGGTNDIKNIQPLCHRCNSKKSNKTIFYGKSNQNTP